MDRREDVLAERRAGEARLRKAVELAVAEERKALREIVRFKVRLFPEERADILAALDVRELLELGEEGD